MPLQNEMGGYTYIYFSGELAGDYSFSIRTQEAPSLKKKLTTHLSVDKFNNRLSCSYHGKIKGLTYFYRNHPVVEKALETVSFAVNRQPRFTGEKWGEADLRKPTFPTSVNRQPQFTEVGIPNFRKLGMPISYRTEITPEITPEITSLNPDAHADERGKKILEGEEDKSELRVIPDPFEDEQKEKITTQDNAATETPLMSGRDSSNVVATNKPNHEDKSSGRGGRNFDCQTTTAEVVEISTETREVRSGAGVKGKHDNGRGESKEEMARNHILKAERIPEGLEKLEGY
ncbi:hypothetical protein NDI34_25150 [Trichocoleus sp. DQ-U1]